MAQPPLLLQEGKFAGRHIFLGITRTDSSAPAGGEKAGGGGGKCGGPFVTALERNRSTETPAAFSRRWSEATFSAVYHSSRVP